MFVTEEIPGIRWMLSAGRKEWWMGLAWRTSGFCSRAQWFDLTELSLDMSLACAPEKVDTCFPQVHDPSPFYPSWRLQLGISAAFRFHSRFWRLLHISSDNQSIQAVAKIKEAALTAAISSLCPRPQWLLCTCAALKHSQWSWHRWERKKGFPKSQSITLFSFTFSFFLNSISEEMEEVVRPWRMVASTSGPVNKCPVFLLSNWGTSTLWWGNEMSFWTEGLNIWKKPWCMTEGRREARVPQAPGQCSHPKPGRTWEQQPELPAHALRDALQHELPCFFCAVHADPLPVLSKVNLPGLLFQKLFGLKGIMKHDYIPKYLEDGKETFQGTSEHFPSWMEQLSSRQNS